LVVYHIIFMLAAVFQFVITLDAIYNQNSIELVSIAIINGGLFGYSIMQYQQARSFFNRVSNIAITEKAGKLAQANFTDHDTIFIITMLASALFFLLFIWQGYKLHKDFGWSIYKRIGADAKLRDMYKMYFVLLMLLKLDVFFYASFALQFLVVVLFNHSESSTTEITLHVVVAAFMMSILIFLAVRAVKTENSQLLIAFLIGNVACICYLAYKLSQALSEQRFETVRKSITFTIVLDILLGIATFIVAFLCYRNFGSGLKPHLSKPKSQTKNAYDTGAPISNPYPLNQTGHFNVDVAPPAEIEVHHTPNFANEGTKRWTLE